MARVTTNVSFDQKEISDLLIERAKAQAGIQGAVTGRVIYDGSPESNLDMKVSAIVQFESHNPKGK